MDRITIWRIKILTGQLETYNGYYPYVQLFEITEEDKGVINIYADKVKPSGRPV
jgi:hypothetical protein